MNYYMAISITIILEPPTGGWHLSYYKTLSPWNKLTSSVARDFDYDPVLRACFYCVCWLLISI